ncbi:LLM class flavin-dependent oxidoreductase [Desertihabitans aurantiacus]|uniref:LLM class flavin-dependent oxidoreductase n=1 Tax=Desertihabitans aurantiacus TaxID=2282477 RepID=UPI0013006BED|nr:LLM class flavin-dependent oxidoreductase [Desertihabitans aurantiacus]
MSPAASSRLEVGIRIPLGAPLPELAAFAGEAEQAGLDGVGVPDHHHTGRDAFMALAAMAGRTERVRLFPATSNVVTRHPLVLAALTSSVDELAPGRAELTVAPGFLSVEKAGEPRARRERLRQVVLALRGLLGEGRAELDGHPLELFNRPAGGSRVTVLASGPRLLELAGEVADGVLMLVGLHPESVAAAREHVAIGARRAGRDPAEIEETLIVPFGVGDAAEARAWIQGWFRPGQPWLRYPSASNLRWLGHAGITLDPDYHPDDVDDATADRVADAFGLFGSAEECAERLLRAREETGLSRAFLFPAHSWDTTYHLPRAEVRAFGEVVGPALRAAGC